MREFFGGNSIVFIAIVGWTAIAITRILSRNRVRELQVRERIAMIEKGLIPPPERDPDHFDRMMSRFDREVDPWASWGRHRRGGIVMIGVGLGLMFMFDFLIPAGRPRVGVGVGGFLIIMGIAFLVSSLFDVRPRYDRDEPRVPSPRAPVPGPPQPPPDTPPPN